MVQTLQKQVVLETKRLTLRPMRRSDAGLISLYSNDERVARMTTSIPHPNPPGAVEQFIASVNAPDARDVTWAIDGSKGVGTEVVGVIALHEDGEIGYWIAPFFWGLGIATEAAGTVLSHGFDLGFKRIYASHFEDNPASGRVMEKIGMRSIGLDPEPVFSVGRGESVRRISYERLRDDG